MNLTLKRDQIWVLIAKDFKLKYNSTALGFLWSLLVPMFTSIVYYFVFGVMMRWDAKNYLLYLMSGTFLWQFFANVILMNGNVLNANSGLLKKTSFDRAFLVRGTFYTESIHFLLTMPVLLGMMAFYRVMPHWSALPNLVVCMAALMLLSMGVSYAYAALNLFFRDLERIMGILMMMWMFCSPVFISVSVVPPELRWLYNLNPMAVILQCWRDAFWAPCFLGAELPSEHMYAGLTHAWHPISYIPILVVSFATYFGGRWIFRKMEPAFAEMM